MKNLPTRKNIRLNEYDYSRAGYYFVTICVKDKHEMLGKIDATVINGGRPQVAPADVSTRLSKIGVIVEQEIAKISNAYDGVFVNKYVIMPNHIHMIIVIRKERESCASLIGGRTQFVPTFAIGRGRRSKLHSPASPTVSRIIKQFKGSITKQVGFSIWQKSYYDHIIRDETEYKKIWQYIDENPAKWSEDKYYG